MSEQSLFDVDEVPAPEPDSPGVRLRKRREDWMARGLHPLSNVMPGLRLHPDASVVRSGPGPRCGDCRFLASHSRNRTYYKCGFYSSHSASSDVSLWWPGCARHEVAQNLGH